MMTSRFILAFLPELVLLAGALGLFAVTVSDAGPRRARTAALGLALATIVAAVFALGAQAALFSDAYRVDAFSQWLKLVFAAGFAGIVLLSGDLPDIRNEIKSEYYLFVTLSVTGLVMLVSCVDVIALIVALELSSFPLYLLVPMRRERPGQRGQMESAIKYIMFGVAANGVMFFGLSYLFGLTGTLHLPEMIVRLQPFVHSPLAVAGRSRGLARQVGTRHGRAFQRPHFQQRAAAKEQLPVVQGRIAHGNQRHVELVQAGLADRPGTP